MKKGIDISTWQGTNDDFVRAKKSGIEFVILRAGFGREASQIDNAFEVNYKKAVQAGLPVGVYWYSYADSAEDAKREAAACMAVIKNKKLSLPVFFDLEEQSQFAGGRAFCSSLVRAFCSELQKNGYRAGLYISYSPFVDFIENDIKEKYPIWIAQYWERCQYDKAAIWQYTDKARVDGFDEPLDMNILYDDGLISGGNESKKEKTIDQLAKEVIQGLWGNGDERKRRLTAAGYDYYAIQKKVNEIMQQPKPLFREQSIVKVKSGAKDYNGRKLANFVYDTNFYIMELVGNRAVIGIDGKVTAAVNTKYLILVK